MISHSSRAFLGSARQFLLGVSFSCVLTVSGAEVLVRIIHLLLALGWNLSWGCHLGNLQITSSFVSPLPCSLWCLGSKSLCPILLQVDAALLFVTQPQKSYMQHHFHFSHKHTWVEGERMQTQPLDGTAIEVTLYTEEYCCSHFETYNLLSSKSTLLFS